MRFLLVAVLLVAFASVAAATDTGNVLIVPDKPLPSGPTGGDGPRVGGDTVADATVIPGLPYDDSGSSCGFINDYDEVCPYTGSNAPDCVYAYMPMDNESITIDLCQSTYDTKVFVYEDVVTPGNPYACNDDAGCGYSGWQSKIEALPVSPGHIYYVVIDGYGGDCGNYILHMEAFEPCECPPGAMPEGEPPLVANYIDNYNGGCNSTPFVWQTLMGNAAGELTFCGHSGTYTYFGSNYRDTDWFIVYATGNLVTFTVEPQFPVNMFQLSVDPSCSNIQVLQQATPGACAPATININTSPGQEVWLWVGPTVFSGLPEFEYTMDLSGIEGGATAVEPSTWGAIKNMYD